MIGKTMIITSNSKKIVESKYTVKKGPQGPQKLSSLKSMKIQNPQPIAGIFNQNSLVCQILGGKTVKNV